jgi:hypothetical protein
MGKKSGSGSGMNNLDHISESLKKTIFWVKIQKFFDADPGSGINIHGSGSVYRKRNRIWTRVVKLHYI